MKAKLVLALGLLGSVAACGSDPDTTVPSATSTTSAGGSAGAQGSGGFSVSGTGGRGGAAGSGDGAGGTSTDADADSDAGGTGGATGGAGGDARADGDAATDGDAGADTPVDNRQPDDPAVDGRGAPDVSDGGLADRQVEGSADGEAGNGLTDADASIDADIGAEAEAEAWTPARLSNLSLWLDAEVGITAAGDLVSMWNDRSGRGNHASQPIVSQRPSLVSGALGGHSVVHFDGQVLSIPDAPTLRWGTGDFTLEAVVSFSNDPNVNDGYGMIYGKFEEPFPYIGPKFWANYYADPSITALSADNRTDEHINSAMTGLNDGKARLYGMRRTSLTHLEVRVNGAASTRTTSITNVDALSSFVFIGGHQAAGGVFQALKGDIAEIVAVGGTLPASDLANLETYLKTKYGL